MAESTNLYSVEIDNVDKDHWYNIITDFKDSNIYQTWAYDQVRYGQQSVSHLILKKDQQIVAATQVRIMKIPLIKAGVAYIRWGPMWKRYNMIEKLEDLYQIIKAIHNEYAEKRGLFLRIIPNEKEQVNNEIRFMIESVGMKWIGKDYRTLYLDLGKSTETIRNNMSKSWRKNLHKAEKRELTVVTGTGMDLFDMVDRLFRETVSRKGFEPGINIDDYRRLQSALPDKIKMQIMVCLFEGKPVAGLIGSALGEAGIELVAATGNDGTELGGSYLLRWKMLEYLKSVGCRYYNLNGINPERNPGGYQFKSGFSGKTGQDFSFIGTFESRGNKFSMFVMQYGNAFFTRYKKSKTFIRNIQYTLHTNRKHK